MPKVISLSSVNVSRTHGDVVAGTVNLDIPLALKQDVTRVKLCLRADIKTHVTVTRVNPSNKPRQREHMWVRILDQQQVIWTPNSSVPHASGVTSFPFSFNLPTGLPPSFHGGSYSTGGSVEYYLHVKATRPAWYQVNAVVNQAFHYLPTDLNAGPSLRLSDWPGPWKVFRASKNMRRGITSQYGLAEAEFEMPNLPSIPLFRPIPVRLRIVCTSKPLSISPAGTPEYEFPRIPKTSHINLNLHQVCNVTVRRYHCTHTNDLGLQAGFGASGDQIQDVIKGPRWTVDGSEGDKGRWSEEVTFTSTLIFRCTPRFNFVPCLSTSLFLALSINFPGVGNNLKIDIGPLPLAPGIEPQQSADSRIPTSLDLPPSYTGPLPLASEAEPQNADSRSLGISTSLDLPPSYYDIDT